MKEKVKAILYPGKKHSLVEELRMVQCVFLPLIIIPASTCQVDFLLFPYLQVS